MELENEKLNNGILFSLKMKYSDVVENALFDCFSLNKHHQYELIKKGKFYNFVQDYVLSHLHDEMKEIRHAGAQMPLYNIKGEPGDFIEMQMFFPVLATNDGKKYPHNFDGIYDTSKEKFQVGQGWRPSLEERVTKKDNWDGDDGNYINKPDNKNQERDSAVKVAGKKNDNKLVHGGGGKVRQMPMEILQVETIDTSSGGDEGVVEVEEYCDDLNESPFLEALGQKMIAILPDCQLAVEMYNGNLDAIHDKPLVEEAHQHFSQIAQGLDSQLHSPDRIDGPGIENREPDMAGVQYIVDALYGYLVEGQNPPVSETQTLMPERPPLGEAAQTRAAGFEGSVPIKRIMPEIEHHWNEAHRDKPIDHTEYEFMVHNDNADPMYPEDEVQYDIYSVYYEPYGKPVFIHTDNKVSAEEAGQDVILNRLESGSVDPQNSQYVEYVHSSGHYSLKGGVIVENILPVRAEYNIPEGQVPEQVNLTY